MLSACGDARLTQVVLETELGDIEVEVYNERAPISSADFLYYVDNGLYDGEGFYRAVRPEIDPRGLGMQIIQGGLLGLESVTASIDHETTQMTGLSHVDGAVSIARDEPGTGSAAYFFISIGDNSSLDFGGARNPDGQGYAVFGQVTKGMDVVRAIQQRETEGPSGNEVTQGQFLTEPVNIIKAERR
ncbi:MAG: peptidylprolyl isomerase [Acidimicrobiales bacterium]|nr:peptidylprolyl isomerase [Hyphomonadaceae bacterium]RZV40676.1 MAG: peptidylprolyl isomerase [Acidimicrobiales bacterium]